MKPFHLMLMILSTYIFFYHVNHLVSLWPDIPYEIGIHYSDGQPDQLGSKSFLLVMPMISLLFWILMQMVVRRPDKLNYVYVTEKNKQLQYRKA
ncbi:DUF1648 domain-containing protein [Bacillus sp. RO3]|nr:DUF1648 domain-containing protein [Bacillus sp. RO3]